MKRLAARIIAVLMIASLGLFGAVIGPEVAWAKKPERKIPKGSVQTTVVRVIDGDTIVISGWKEENRIVEKGKRVRLIGVDTPETVHPRKPREPYGEEAKSFTGRHLADRQVYLEFDKRKKDRYGRLLAYVWLSDGTLFNALLVEKGYARVRTIRPNVKYATLFKLMEDEARSEGRGLWGQSAARQTGAPRAGPSRAGFLRAGPPWAGLLRAWSPGAGSPRAGSPRANSPRAPTTTHLLKRLGMR